MKKGIYWILMILIFCIGFGVSSLIDTLLSADSPEEQWREAIVEYENAYGKITVTKPDYESIKCNTDVPNPKITMEVEFTPYVETQGLDFAFKFGKDELPFKELSKLSEEECGDTGPLSCESRGGYFTSGSGYCAKFHNLNETPCYTPEMCDAFMDWLDDIEREKKYYEYWKCLDFGYELGG